MSTEYVLEIGYMSGYSYRGDYDSAWRELAGCVQVLAHDPQVIIAEAKRLGAPDTCEHGCCTLMTYAEAYAREDGPLVVNEDEHYIVQLSTGERSLKEHVRRAFCRLVIEQMHRKGIEVNMRVS